MRGGGGGGGGDGGIGGERVVMYVTLVGSVIAMMMTPRSSLCGKSCSRRFRRAAIALFLVDALVVMMSAVTTIEPAAIERVITEGCTPSRVARRDLKSMMSKDD